MGLRAGSGQEHVCQVAILKAFPLLPLKCELRACSARHWVFRVMGCSPAHELLVKQRAGDGGGGGEAVLGRPL